MLKASSKLQIVKRKQETGNREHSSRASILFTVYCLPITKKAFTLAEVLITLGIIGTVAALTIPTLINNKAKQETVTKLQKSYTTLSQAVKLSEQDNGSNANWDWGTAGNASSIRNSFDTYWRPYLKVIKDCDNTNNCGYGDGYFYIKDKSQHTSLVGPNNIAELLSDGTLLELYNDGTHKIIYVDINGSLAPNILSRDVFSFVLDPQKGFVPYYYNSGSPIINANCTTTSNDMGCAAKIMIDSWQIKDDYPW